VLEPSDKERLATLEANIPWIIGSLERLELAEKERAKTLERHLLKHGNRNGGVQIIIGKRALTLLASIPLGGGAVAAYLKSIGAL